MVDRSSRGPVKGRLGGGNVVLHYKSVDFKRSSDPDLNNLILDLDPIGMFFVTPIILEGTLSIFLTFFDFFSDFFST